MVRSHDDSSMSEHQIEFPKVNMIFKGFFILVFVFLFLGFTNLSLALVDESTPEYLRIKNNSVESARPENPPVILDHGGPDGGGYYFIDSNDDAVNHPVFNWIDISSYGINIGFTLDDELFSDLSIGFPFTYYGGTYTQFSASTNGWIGFGSYVNSFLNNAAIPASGLPNDILAVFWDDLHPRTAGIAYYYTNNIDTLIVSYTNWDRYSPQGSNYNFQIILTGDGNILYQYAGMSGTLDSYTVGIENSDGTIGLEYNYNAYKELSNTAIYFGPDAPVFGAHNVSAVTILSPAGFINIGDIIQPVAKVTNVGQNNESFNTRFVIAIEGAPIYDQSVMVDSLITGELRDITFPQFTVTQTGQHDLTAITLLDTDVDNSNDTVRASAIVIGGGYSSDFESNNGYLAGTGDWEWGVPSSGPGNAHSGSNVWATILGGNYHISMLSELSIPSFQIGALGQLSFYHWYDTENRYDGGNVKISTDGGSTWELLHPNEGYDIDPQTANPLYPDSIFSGHTAGNFWHEEIFNLDAYASQTIILKFCFGSDASLTYAGWYIDDLSISWGEPGFLTGIVRDLTSMSPLDQAIVSTDRFSDTTGIDGVYGLEIGAGIYSVSAIAPFHNEVTIDSIVIVSNDTSFQDFLLPGPAIAVDETPIDTSIAIGDSVTYIRTITNSGNGQLDFDISISMAGRILNHNSNPVLISNAGEETFSTAEQMASETSEYSPSHGPGNPPTIADFGDEVFIFDPQTQTGDEGCIGIEFDGSYFWVTGRNPADGIHKLHQFNRDGVYIQSFDQGTTSFFGWRDLAWDGTYLYASDENEFARIDPSLGERIDTLPMPAGITPPLRALAYDPETAHFWTANFESNIIEFDSSGATINSYQNSNNIYGFAWDDASADGPWLWVFSQDGTPPAQISQFDPVTGTYTGISFQAIDHNGGDDDIAGGACFTTEWDATIGIFFGMVQGTFSGQSYDLVQGYEITPFSRWLNINPTSGSLAPAQSANILIKINFAGEGIIQDSTYEAEIIINNNSAVTPQIPVSARATGGSGADDNTSNLPVNFTLMQNYPNPFNASTIIKFDLPEQSKVKLEVFNIIGQKVAVLYEGDLMAGTHQISWDASGVSSGIYYFKLNAGKFESIRQMTLLK